MQDIKDSAAHARQTQSWASILAMTALAVGLVYVLANGSGRLGALWLVGAGLGFALYHAAFGFTGAYRTCIATGRSGAVPAQMLMLALAVVLFFPALAAGTVFGQPVRGFVFPAGWEVAIGAFLFGIGMQLGGGCASGTLYATGGGDSRTGITLICFVAGMTLGAWDIERWAALPARGAAVSAALVFISPAALVDGEDDAWQNWRDDILNGREPVEGGSCLSCRLWPRMARRCR